MAVGEQQSEAATKAEADDADPSRAALLPGQPGSRGIDIGERRAMPPRQIPHRRDEAAGAAAPGEEIRSDGQVSRARQPVSLPPQVGSHPHGVMEDDDPRPRAVRAGFGEIAVKPTSWGGREFSPHPSDGPGSRS
jgi:hypothetical protein